MPSRPDGTKQSGERAAAERRRIGGFGWIEGTANGTFGLMSIELPTGKPTRPRRRLQPPPARPRPRLTAGDPRPPLFERVPHPRRYLIKQFVHLLVAFRRINGGG